MARPLSRRDKLRPGWVWCRGKIPVVANPNYWVSVNVAMCITDLADPRARAVVKAAARRTMPKAVINDLVKDAMATLQRWRLPTKTPGSFGHC